MSLSQNFKSASHNSHMKNRILLTNFFMNFFKNCDFFFKTNRPIFINYHTKNMFPFNNINMLIKQYPTSFFQAHFKILLIVIKFLKNKVKNKKLLTIGEHKLWLEFLPNRMRMERSYSFFAK